MSTFLREDDPKREKRGIYKPLPNPSQAVVLGMSTRGVEVGAGFGEGVATKERSVKISAFLTKGGGKHSMNNVFCKDF